jgi:Fe2+ transport system protein B
MKQTLASCSNNCRGTEEQDCTHHKTSEIVVIGLESVGKSQLISTLTNSLAVTTGNFRGTTVSCERYRFGNTTIIDTPGILREQDNQTTKLALEQLEANDRVLVVMDGTQLDRSLETLEELRPRMVGKRGVIVVTFWDKIAQKRGVNETIDRISNEIDMKIICVNAKEVTDDQRNSIIEQLNHPQEFPKEKIDIRVNWIVEAPRGVLEFPIIGPFVALNLLLVPAWIAVQNANSFADRLYTPVADFLNPLLDRIAAFPVPLNHVLGGSYGFVAMLPFLVLYALPTVLAFAIILGAYKASGLIDRLTVSLHPIIRPFGLAGRDLVRVVMGFGCNVPAIISTRSCSNISRKTCMSAICFGAACSYQLPATIAIFTAAGMSELTLPYLLILATSTLIYLRLTAPKSARSEKNRLMIARTPFTQWPSIASTFREAWGVIYQFLFVALPIFFAICVIASLLSWSGVLKMTANVLGQVMVIFNLPADASIPVILGSIRKDGIAIGLLDSNWETLKVSLATPVQVMTIVFLSGVLLPCMVSLVTVIREMKWRFALKVALQQSLFVVVVSLVIAWVGRFLFG